MTKREKGMAAKNLDLIFEFEKCVLEHPDSCKEVPRNAVVSMRVKVDEPFNHWSRQLAETQIKKRRRPIVLVTIKKMKPAMSRIEEVKIEQAA